MMLLRLITWPYIRRHRLRTALTTVGIVLGVAVLIGSFTMDRLERQGVNPYTVPGLLPGLLGIAMMGLPFLARAAPRMKSACPPTPL